MVTADDVTTPETVVLVPSVWEFLDTPAYACKYIPYQQHPLTAVTNRGLWTCSDLYLARCEVTVTSAFTPCDVITGSSLGAAVNSTRSAGRSVSGVLSH